MEAAPVPHVIVNGIIAYRVDFVLPFVGQTKVKPLTSDIFSYECITWIDKTFDDLDTELETYATLTQVQGHILVLLGVNLPIKSFVQCVRREVCTGRNP